MMAGFAPSYYHESNNSWLNDLVADIIEPGSRAQARTPNRDGDIGDSAGHSRFEIDSQTIQGQRAVGRRGQSQSPLPSRRGSSASQNSRQSSSYNNAVHYSYRQSISQPSQAPGRASSRLSTSTPFRDTPCEPISEDGGPLSLNPFYREHMHVQPDLNPQSRTPRETPLSQRRLLLDAEKLEPADRSDSFSSDYYPDKISGWDDESRTLAGVDDRVPSRTSLGRTYSQKRFADMLQTPPLARISSSTTQDSSVFAPHPAVRIFSERDRLGEAAGPSESDNHEYPGKFALMLIVTGICLSVFIISVDRSIVTTAIPRITQTFGSYDDIGWYGSAYFLTASAFQPLYGRVYMAFDTRWTFLAAVAIFEIGSLLGAVSPSSTVLILGRAVQGFGSAGILTGSFVVGTHSVPLKGRPILFAFVGILYGFGALAGPLLGGIFTDLLNWRWCFWINLPIGAVTFLAVLFFFKPRKNKDKAQSLSWVRRILELDLIGNVIILAACTMLFLALQTAETRGSWSGAPVIGLLCGFGVTSAVFIVWLIYRGETALIPLRIICQRTVASSCGIAFFLYGGLLMHAYYLPIWFQAIKGDSAVHSGVSMIPYMLANALFSLIAGIFVSKNGLFAPPAIIGAAIGTVGCGLLFTLDPDTSTGSWIGYEILVSAGLGMAIQQGFNAVQTALPLEEVPIGTAAVVACQSLGGAIFVNIGNTILQVRLLNPKADETVPGVDVRTVFEAGATAFRSIVPPDQLPALVRLYNNSLRYVFLAAVPLVGVSFLCALCMEWRSVRARPETAAAEETVVRASEKA